MISVPVSRTAVPVIARAQGAGTPTVSLAGSRFKALYGTSVLVEQQDEVSGGREGRGNEASGP